MIDSPKAMCIGGPFATGQLLSLWGSVSINITKYHALAIRNNQFYLGGEGS